MRQDPLCGGSCESDDLADQEHDQGGHARTASLASSSSADDFPRAPRRESDDDYHAAIVGLDARRRIVDCADNLQWICQRKDGNRWRGVSFFRDRDTLIERTGATGAALAILRTLPRRHP
jgi:hypothetical protein